MVHPSSFIPILMIGLNHKNSSVEVRERLAFGAERIPGILCELVYHNVVDEAVLLSTCNRSECYICTCHPVKAESRLLALLSRQASISIDQLQSMLYTMRGEHAAQHLMQVAVGLDSLIIGENEIIGQVRSAAELAHSAGTIGPFLSALFRYAVQAGKRARAETEIGHANISVASVVVELAEQVFGSLNNRTALLIGAGKISSITARALTRAGLNFIMVANRTFERAEKLAKNLRGVAVHFDRLDEVLIRADIVICSTGAPHVILHREAVEKAQIDRSNRPLFIADLAVPRDVDPMIASLPGVKLVNIDDLDSAFKTGHSLTSSICQEIEQIIQQELESFRQWSSARRCAPVIQALHEKAEDVYQAEVEQTLRRIGNLTPKQERLIHAMGKAIAGKLLYEPTARLHEKSSDEDIAAYLELVQDLYGIE